MDNLEMLYNLGLIALGAILYIVYKVVKKELDIRKKG